MLHWLILHYYLRGWCNFHMKLLRNWKIIWLSVFRMQYSGLLLSCNGHIFADLRNQFGWERPFCWLARPRPSHRWHGLLFEAYIHYTVFQVLWFKICHCLLLSQLILNLKWCCFILLIMFVFLFLVHIHLFDSLIKMQFKINKTIKF